MVKKIIRIILPICIEKNICNVIFSDSSFAEGVVV